MAFILLILTGCTPISEEPKPGGPVVELPLAEYKDTTILNMYEGSRLSWVLKTRYLVKWSGTDRVRARPVDLTVYDSLGKVLVRVNADSGTVDEAVSFLAATGNVHGRSEKGVDIKSDSLRWNKAINQISTEARVRVISEDGDVLTGKGFISDAKLDNWQILSDVKGVFQKVGERIEASEKDTSKQALSGSPPIPADSGSAIPAPIPGSAPAPGGDTAAEAP